MTSIPEVKATPQPPDTMKSIGMIGLDTSHVVGLNQEFNHPESPEYLGGAARIVKAFPGGSQLTSVSRDRVANYTRQLADDGIQMVGSIADLADMDAFIMTSVDGRQHLEQFQALLPFGKPVFIDKPLTCSYAEAVEIFRLAKEHNVPVMSCSSVRYMPPIDAPIPDYYGKILAATTYAPMTILPDYPGYFWYGIHATELLYSILGIGCATVRALQHGEFNQLVGHWADGRLGTAQGNGKRYRYAAMVSCERGIVARVNDPGLPAKKCFAVKMLDFLLTGNSPVPAEDTLEIMAFLEAANRSLAEGSREVALDEVRK